MHSPSPTPENTGSFRTLEAARIEISRFLAAIREKQARVLSAGCCFLHLCRTSVPGAPPDGRRRVRRGEATAVCSGRPAGAARPRFWFAGLGAAGKGREKVGFEGKRGEPARASLEAGWWSVAKNFSAFLRLFKHRQHLSICSG
jgi:hypothetical protein